MALELQEEPDKGRATIHVVEDEKRLSDDVEGMLRSAALPHRIYPTGDEFLEAMDPGMRGCLILDIYLPGMTGFELIRKMQRNLIFLPTLVLTGRADVSMVLEAKRLEVFDFLQKPISNHTLLERVRAALEYEAIEHDRQQERSTILRRMGTLTPREHEVMGRVVEGQSNRAIARALELSPKTVEVHRARVMRKMKAQSLVDLVRMCVKVESYQEAAWSGNGL